MRLAAPLLFAAAMLAGAASAHAADGQAPVPGVAESPAPATEKLVCKRESFVGSKMTKKTCRTAAEWRSIQAAERQTVSDRDRNDER